MRRKIGIYDGSISVGGGGERRMLALAEHLSHKHEVYLIVGESCQPDQLASYFGMDLSRIRLLVLPTLPNLLQRLLESPRLTRRYAIYTKRLHADLTRLLESRCFDPIKALGLDVFINGTWASNLVCPATHGVYMCMFPHALRGALQNDPVGRLTERAHAWLGNRLLGQSQHVLNSYSVITANSQYTADWIRRLWDRSATVVYSASEPMGPPGEKDLIILHVGRFVGEGRADYKHQRVLLEAFKQLYDLHQTGWQLHLAGTLRPDASATAMAARLVEAARGYPVQFHFSASLDNLRDLYRRARLYWHATGYGSSADMHPGRQEHFGNTIVEAMSAGVVPVVLNSGGPREVVSAGVNGFLWNDVPELIERTRQLAGDSQLWQKLSEQAVLSSAGYTRTAYCERMERMIDSFPA